MLINLFNQQADFKKMTINNPLKNIKFVSIAVLTIFNLSLNHSTVRAEIVNQGGKPVSISRRSLKLVKHDSSGLPMLSAQTKDQTQNNFKQQNDAELSQIQQIIPPAYKTMETAQSLSAQSLVKQDDGAMRRTVGQSLIANFFGGKASWYGPGFHGRLTANGERYNQNAMTAAHRSLRFGTRVKVTNLRNGRSVIVRINDRGPFIHGRVIDLSAAAARSLNMVHSGVAPVQIKILGR